MKLNVAHLYSELLNIYGDKGNVLAFVNRCSWRNIEVNITEINVGDEINPDLYDFYFIGGGQDEQQIAVAQELQKQKDNLINARDNMAVFLSICGGYQLLGHYYKPHAGDKLEGISLLDAYTVAGNTRFIGNVTVELSNLIANKAKNLSNYKSLLESKTGKTLNQVQGDNKGIIVGFENHSGLTYLQGETKPIGIVTTGNGNNGSDRTEGGFYKNVFGTYLHGSFLPKNPHFTDYLISLALERNYGKVELEPLNDNIELAAHKKAIGRKY